MSLSDLTRRRQFEGSSTKQRMDQITRVLRLRKTRARRRQRRATRTKGEQSERSPSIHTCPSGARPLKQEMLRMGWNKLKRFLWPRWPWRVLISLNYAIWKMVICPMWDSSYLHYKISAGKVSAPQRIELVTRVAFGVTSSSQRKSVPFRMSYRPLKISLKNG